MSNIIRVVPEEIGMKQGAQESIDDSFTEFIEGLNGVEEFKMSKVRAKYHEWASILQAVSGQFIAISEVFQQIEANSNSWIVSPYPDNRYRGHMKTFEVDGNGYEFDVSINYFGFVSPDKRDNFRTSLSSRLLNPEKQISFTYGDCYRNNHTLDGKSRIQRIGHETELGLPARFALHHNTIDKDALREFALQCDDNDLPKGMEKIEIKKKGYDLTGFYQSESTLDYNLDRARNHLVFLQVTSLGGDRQEVGFEPRLFGQYDMEHITKYLFIILNRNEAVNIRQYIPGCL